MRALDLWRGNRPSLLSGSSIFDNWDSFTSDFERLFNEMDRMMSPSIGRTSMMRGETLFNPPCDIEEQENNYVLSFDLPGIAKDEIDIQVVDNQLVVCGERKREHEHKEGGVYRAEKQYGRFQRVFNLPQGTDTEAITAHYENGVLHVAIPKSELARPKKISVQEGKGGFFQRLVGKSKDEQQAS